MRNNKDDQQMIKLFIVIFFALMVACSYNQSDSCNVQNDPMCVWLKAPYPPIEIQPEIGEMISAEKWKNAQNLKERRELIINAWKSREQKLSEALAQIKELANTIVSDAAKRAKSEPQKRIKIFKEAEKELRSISFGPASAAIPIEEWVFKLKTTLEIKDSNLEEK